MAVSVEGPIFIRPYRGFDNPALPVAHWMAAEFLLGDLTGGSADFTIFFKPGGQPLSGRLFNLEELLFSSSINTEPPVSLQTIGMDRFNALLGPSTWDQSFQLQQGNFESTQPATLSLAFPAFLGAAVSVPTAAALQATVANTNGNFNRLRAMGYIWEARSLLAEGGPQRPATSLYGR